MRINVSFQVTKIQVIMECFTSNRVSYPSTGQLVADIFSQEYYFSFYVYFILVPESRNL